MEVAWLGVYPALPIQFRKAWGGGENVATLHYLWGTQFVALQGTKERDV